MRKRKAADVASLHKFENIPALIHSQGRAEGFTKLRDMLLEDWEGMSARMNPYSAFKLILETDRHAMFAEVAAEKSKGAFDRELWNRFEDYLHGNVEALGITPEEAAPPSVHQYDYTQNLGEPEEEEEENNDA